MKADIREIPRVHQISHGGYFIMALFGKKKEQQKDPACVCNSHCPTTEVAENTSESCSKVENSICCIKVLGSGCASCHTQFENAKEAVKKIGLSVEVEYVTDLQKIMKYGVMSMPALVVNEKIVSAGKVLKPADVEKQLHKLGF